MNIVASGQNSLPLWSSALDWMKQLCNVDLNINKISDLKHYVLLDFGKSF
jgi:hypothetical protein